ncbi:MAG: lysophospholipid acyltransferase family protein [Novosphingobium sp.]
MEQRRSAASRVTLWILLWLYRRQKWTIIGGPPATRRCVLIGAPHTTNWDFVFFVGITHELGVLPGFMGKASLFKWPFARFMHDMGGVPVVRSSSHNYVDQMIEEFARRKELMLVVAPEGTRRGSPKWKSGFYHIAQGAGVPIIPAWVNHETRCGGLGPAIMPTGDFRADMEKIAAFFIEMMPGHPRWAAIMARLDAND